MNKQIPGDKKHRFGNKLLEDDYNAVMKFVFDNELCKFYALSKTERKNTIVIFNTFRIVKNNKTGQLSFQKRNHNTGKFRKSSEFCDLQLLYHSKIPLENILINKLFKLIEQYIKLTVFYAEIIHTDFFNPKIKYTDRDLRDPDKYQIYPTATINGMSSWQLNAIIKSRLRKFCFSSANCLGLIKILRNEFFDKEIIQICQKFFNSYFNINEYIYIEKNITTLKKINKEYPNLVPFLQVVEKEHWDKPDLFSYKNWVGHNPYALDYLKENVILFKDKKTFRFFKSLKLSVIKRMSNDMNMSSYYSDLFPFSIETFMNVKNIRFSKFYKEKIIINILYLLFRGRDCEAIDHSKIELIANCCSDHIDFLEKEMGYKNLCRVYENSFKHELKDVIDFVLDTNYEIKKNQSFVRLLQLTREWELQQSKIEKKVDNVNWTGILNKKFDSDDYFIKEITSSDDLFMEGYEMKHCVYSYLQAILSGKYVVFSIKNKEERATLGVTKNKEKWELDQVRGRYNEQVSSDIKRTSKLLIKEINF